MNHFPELIRILDRFREPRIETLDGEFRSNNADKSFLLYEGIRQGKFQSDLSAARSIYDSSAVDPRYATLKSRLKWRLLNTLFHLNLRRAGFSRYATAMYQTHRRSFLSQALLMLGARNAAMKMAERTLRDAIEYQFTQIVVEMATILRTHASLIASDTLYEKYDRVLKDSLYTLQVELMSWEYSERAQSARTKYTNFSEALVGQIAEYEEALASVKDEIRTATFLTNYYRVAHVSALSRKDFRKVIEICNEAVAYFRTVPHLVFPVRIAEFAMGKLEAYTSLLEYDNAVLAALECKSQFAEGTNNWFTFSERHFALLLLSRRFVEASELFEHVTSHPRFAAMPAIWQERWKIFELYLQFALQTVPEYESLPLRKKFDLQAFLRFIPVASKDKHGMYVAVLIIHILYMLESGDFNGIIDRMDALRTYRTRYLRGKTNRRSALFFRLLTIMENNSFNYTLVRQKSDRIFKQLRETSPDMQETNEEIQIIPYEWLWERVLAKLKEYEEVGSGNRRTGLAA